MGPTVTDYFKAFFPEPPRSFRGITPIDELPTYQIWSFTGNKLERCLYDGTDRQKVITGCQDYLCQMAIDAGEYGKGEMEVSLITNRGSMETEEIITISWLATKEEPFY